MTDQFNKLDTKRPDGCYVHIVRVTEPEEYPTSPLERDEGFYPSRDKDATGYMGEVTDEEFNEAYAKAHRRYKMFESGELYYIGIRAKAEILIVKNGTGTLLSFQSAGVYGFESDTDKRELEDVYVEQEEELKELIKALASPIYELEKEAA